MSLAFIAGLSPYHLALVLAVALLLFGTGLPPGARLSGAVAD